MESDAWRCHRSGSLVVPVQVGKFRAEACVAYTGLHAQERAASASWQVGTYARPDDAYEWPLTFLCQEGEDTLVEES